MRKGYLVVVISTILISLATPLFILYLYRGSLTGLPFQFSLDGISHNSSNWSDFGSLLSGLFTLSGAIATLVALLFAIQQNIKLDEEAQKRSKEDAITSAKNEVFIELQKEKINFEKFRLHQIMFGDVLDSLENDYFNEYRFTSRTLFYKNLFHNNSFTNCFTTIDSELDKPKSIKDIINSAQMFDSQMKSGGYYRNPDIFVDDISNLKQILMLRTVRATKDSDITFAKKNIVLNIIDLQNELNFLTDTINSLCSFAEVDRQIDLTKNYNHSKMVIELVHLTMTFDFAKVMSTSYPYETKHDVYLKAIVELFDDFQMDERNPLYPHFKYTTNYILSALSASNIHNLVTTSGFQHFVNNFHDKVINATLAATAQDPSLDIVANTYATRVLRLRGINKN